MNVFVEEKTLNDSDFDEIDEFSSIKKELQVFCGTADATLNVCVLSKEFGLHFNVVHPDQSYVRTKYEPVRASMVPYGDLVQTSKRLI